MAEKKEAVVVKKKAEAKKADSDTRYGTGRRKNSVARVSVSPGKGDITVNGKKVEEYFARPVLRMILNQPFGCLLYTSPSPRDRQKSRMPSSA